MVQICAPVPIEILLFSDHEGRVLHEAQVILENACNVVHNWRTSNKVHEPIDQGKWLAAHINDAEHFLYDLCVKIKHSPRGLPLV